MFIAPDVTFAFQQRLKKLAIYFAGISCVTGALVLAGWQFNIEPIKRIIPGLVAMNPATAICFMITGSAVILINRYGADKNAGYAWRIGGLIAALTGMMCLVINLGGTGGAPDQFFFTEKLKDEVSNLQNRMAPNTAFNFILTGIALFLFTPAPAAKPFSPAQPGKISQYLVLITAFISLLSIVGYIYGVRSFYGVLTYIPMALHTSFCFLLVSAAVLLTTCDEGFMAAFTNNYVGSILARRLIPAIITVPVFLGFIIIYGENAGLYVAHFGTALFTILTIIIFVFLIKKIQTSVNRADMARTAAEKKLAELNTQLEEKSATLQMLNTELEAFSYSISHDLKAPLRAIQGFTTMLKDGNEKNVDENGRRMMENIIKSARKMDQLIKDLLEFSRIRRTELQNSYCDMDMLVKNVLKEQYLALKKNEYDIKIGELYPCAGDPKMIEQVWVNLISNALKYSGKRDKPVIEIGATRQGDKTIYFVKDNGAGFDMSYADKLFSVFQRMHSEKEFEGTGIGLAIVQQIITRHGGKVWAEAKVNEGANFYFSMPAK